MGSKLVAWAVLSPGYTLTTLMKRCCEFSADHQADLLSPKHVGPMY